MTSSNATFSMYCVIISIICVYASTYHTYYHESTYCFPIYSGFARLCFFFCLIIGTGILCLMIGAFPALVIVNISLCYAYKHIIGIHTWSTNVSFAWQENTPALLGLSCEATQLYNSNNSEGMIGIGYGEGNVYVADDHNVSVDINTDSALDDDSHSNTHKHVDTRSGNGYRSTHSHINRDIDNEGTGVSFKEDVLDF